MVDCGLQSICQNSTNSHDTNTNPITPYMDLWEELEFCELQMYPNVLLKKLCLLKFHFGLIEWKTHTIMQRKAHTKQQINVNLKVLKSSLCIPGKLAQSTCNAYILLIMGCIIIPRIALNKAPATRLKLKAALRLGPGDPFSYPNGLCRFPWHVCPVPVWISIFAQRYVQSGLVRNLLNSKFVVFAWIFAILTMAWHWSLHHEKACCYVWLSKSQSDWQAQSTGTCFFSMENAHMLNPLVNTDHDWLQCLYISKVYNLTPIYWLSVMHFSMRICTNRVGATPIAARFS